MKVNVLIPLIATIAYIPLFVILLSNRPWQRRHRLFLLFLIPAALWSLDIIFFRSGFLMPHKRLLIGIGICSLIWMLVQLHYFISSFYRSERIKIPLTYLFLVATIVLVSLKKIPENVYPISNELNVVTGIAVDYGGWIIAICLAFLLTVGAKDIYSLVQKHNLSSNPAERNQIVYLLLAIGTLTVFILSSLAPRGGEYPISHIGNFIVACVFTYAVISHRLLDIGIVFRKALIYVVLYGGSIGIVLLLFWLAQRRSPDFERYFTSLAVTISLGIPAILFLVHKVRDIWQRKVEETFVGARYPYRRQLSQFITGIHGVPTLDQLGKELTSLVAQSVDCRRACLLLPEAGDGDFSAQFTYPPVEDNPLRELKLRRDSPIVTWLKQKGTILMEGNLDILPEFQSIWQEEREEIRSAGVEMFVPLINIQELVAVLAISERRDRRLYTVEDIDLLEFVSNRVAASTEKEHLHALVKEQGEEISLVNRLTTILTSSVSIQRIFEGFTQELKNVLDIDWATVGVIDGDELYFLALSSTTGSAWQIEEKIPLKGTATELVCHEKKSIYESDLKRHHTFWTGEYHLQQGFRSIVYLPLIVPERSIGSLILASRKPNAYSNRQIKLLERVAAQIAAPVENARLYAMVEQRSRIDELTGLFNRRHFEELLKEEISRHSRYGEVLSIFILDLDNFKNYNDIYGHPAGDILLKQLGKIIKDSLRNVDKAFRYGGDEFVAILPKTDKDDAYVVAERVRGQLAGEMEKQAIKVTCSIGLASYPADGVLYSELVDVADTALYYAKRTGGNRIYLSSKILPRPPEDGKFTGIDTRREGLSAVYALISTVEAKDPYTYGHSKKVNTYAVALAERIGLSPDEVSKVSTAALIHDIGIIGIPDRVLNKKGALNEGDLQVIRAHPQLGAIIVGNISSLIPCESGILHHHERWDGSGYPEGLKGEEIPIEARILAIADSYAAMTSARPYRPPLSHEEIIKELRQGAGTQFDPKLVEVFIGIIEAGLSEKVKIGQDASREQQSP